MNSASKVHRKAIGLTLCSGAKTHRQPGFRYKSGPAQVWMTAAAARVVQQSGTLQQMLAQGRIHNRTEYMAAGLLDLPVVEKHDRQTMKQRALVIDLKRDLDLFARALSLGSRSAVLNLVLANEGGSSSLFQPYRREDKATSVENWAWWQGKKAMPLPRNYPVSNRQREEEAKIVRFLFTRQGNSRYYFVLNQDKHGFRPTAISLFPEEFRDSHRRLNKAVHGAFYCRRGSGRFVSYGSMFLVHGGRVLPCLARVEKLPTDREKGYQSRLLPKYLSGEVALPTGSLGVTASSGAIRLGKDQGRVIYISGFEDGEQYLIKFYGDQRDIRIIVYDRQKNKRAEVYLRKNGITYYDNLRMDRRIRRMG